MPALKETRKNETIITADCKLIGNISTKINEKLSCPVRETHLNMNVSFRVRPNAPRAEQGKL